MNEGGWNGKGRREEERRGEERGEVGVGVGAMRCDAMRSDERKRKGMNCTGTDMYMYFIVCTVNLPSSI